MKAEEGSKNGEKTHLNIEGELTIYRAGEIKEMIMPAIASGQDFEIDLSRVTEMDSAGLQVMLSAKLESIVAGSKMSLVGHSPAVQEVLDICDLGSFFGDPVVLS